MLKTIALSFHTETDDDDDDDDNDTAIYKAP